MVINIIFLLDTLSDNSKYEQLSIIQMVIVIVMVITKNAIKIYRFRAL